MNALGALLLSLALASPQVVTPVRRAAAAGACTIPDETNTFLAVWLMEEATSATRTNESTNCGSDCDMDNNASVEQSTTKVEGTYSAHFTDADGDYLSCPNGASAGECDELSHSGSATFLAWVRVDDVDNLQSWYGGLDQTSANHGIECYMANAGDVVRITVGDGTDRVTESGLGLTVDTWTHVICRTDATADELETFRNGASGGTTTQQDMAATTLTDIMLGERDGGGGFDGYMDEAAYIDQYLSDAEGCHVCSCGISNWRGCTASGADPSGYDNTGNNTNCASCTLPTNACDPIS
jgi:hypothetical protein